MKPSEIARSYDSIAHRWLEPHLEMNGIKQHERALQFRSDGGVALDVGSGCSGRFVKLLQSHGYEVEGLDISPEMISLAKIRNPDITFHLADVTEWIPRRQYDFITAWDSIWHVPQAQAEGVLKKLCDALTVGGILIWTAGGLDEPGEKLDSAMGVPMYYGVLGIPKMLETVTRAGCVCRHLEFDQFPEKHVFVIAQKVD